jgi:hypothetical protein
MKSNAAADTRLQHTETKTTTQTQMCIFIGRPFYSSHEPSRFQHIPALAKMFCAGIFINAPSITHDEDPEARQ